ARAQGVGPLRTVPVYSPQPAVSPYINLVRRGSSPGINYYGLVRPEIEFRNAVQSLQQQVTSQAAAEQALASLPETGHATAFMNYAHYYTSGLTPGAGSAPAGGGRPPGGSSPATTTAPRAPAR